MNFVGLYPVRTKKKMLKTFLLSQVGRSPLCSRVWSSGNRGLRGLKESSDVFLSVPGPGGVSTRTLHRSSLYFNKNKAAPAGVIEEGEEEFIIRCYWFGLQCYICV